MKTLCNNNGSFATLELPDYKLYSIQELKNCTIPPIFILYKQELFQFNNFDSDSAIASYSGCGRSSFNNAIYTLTIENLISIPSEFIPSIISDSETYLQYNMATKTLIDSYTIEDIIMGRRESQSQAY